MASLASLVTGRAIATLTLTHQNPPQHRQQIRRISLTHQTPMPPHRQHLQVCRAILTIIRFTAMETLDQILTVLTVLILTRAKTTVTQVTIKKAVRKRIIRILVTLVGRVAHTQAASQPPEVIVVVVAVVAAAEIQSSVVTVVAAALAREVILSPTLIKQSQSLTHAMKFGIRKTMKKDFKLKQN